jgi:sulfatase maturation enzyme AslB (radical SAM superfamily)
MKLDIRSDSEIFYKFIDRGRGKDNYEIYLLNDDERVLAALEGRFTPPKELEIQPSSLCNLECKHCIGSALAGGVGCVYRLKNKIDEKVMEKIVRDVVSFRLDDLKIDVAKFCGTTGEPLVNDATAYGIERFHQEGKDLVLFSNGSLLDRKIGDKTFIDYVMKVNRFNLSLDAGSEDVFFNIKGKREFGHTLDNLVELSRRRNGLKKPYIVVSYVVTSGNYKDILRAAEVVGKTGADELKYRVDFTDAFGMKRFADDIISSFRVLPEFESKSFKINIMCSEKEIRGEDECFGKIYTSLGRKCFNYNSWGCIGPNAELYACGHRTYTGVVSYGSLLENSLQELWCADKRLRSVESLPDQFCKFCSPFSLRANELLNFLNEIGSERARELIKEYKDGRKNK